MYIDMRLHTYIFITNICLLLRSFFYLIESKSKHALPLSAPRSPKP